MRPPILSGKAFARAQRICCWRATWWQASSIGALRPPCPYPARAANSGPCSLNPLLVLQAPKIGAEKPEPREAAPGRCKRVPWRSGPRTATPSHRACVPRPVTIAARDSTTAARLSCRRGIHGRRDGLSERTSHVAHVGAQKRGHRMAARGRHEYELGQRQRASGW